MKVDCQVNNKMSVDYLLKNFQFNPILVKNQGFRGQGGVFYYCTYEMS